MAALQQLQPSPETYARQNYLIDQAKKRFTNCVKLIVNDSKLTGDDLVRSLQVIWPTELPHKEPEQLAEVVRCTYIQAQIEYINVIIENFKNNEIFVSLLRDNLTHLNTINNRLQDTDFINSLKSANGNLSNYTHPRHTTYQDREYYLIYTLNQCFTGITDNNMYNSGPGGHYQQPPTRKITWPNHIDNLFINNLVFEFLQYKTTPPHVHASYIQNTQPYIMSILPINSREGTPMIDIDLQYFQRYFQCVLDCLTALLGVNTIYDTDLGKLTSNITGGKPHNKLKTRKLKSKRAIKSKRRFVKQ